MSTRSFALCIHTLSLLGRWTIAASEQGCARNVKTHHYAPLVTQHLVGPSPTRPDHDLELAQFAAAHQLYRLHLSDFIRAKGCL